ncbi:polysaccharide biosynthesis protein [Streptococcus cameli]
MIDTLLILFSMKLSLAFVDFFTSISRVEFLISVAIILTFYFAIATHLKIFSIINRYTDYRVLFSLFLSVTAAHFALLLLSFFFKEYSYRFLFLSWFFTFPVLMLPRLTWRILTEIRESSAFLPSKKKKRRTLVVGAGSGGRLFVNTVLSGSSDIEIVGIVDGDVNKHGTYIHGIKVLGDRNDIPYIVKNYDVNQVTIAIPSLAGAEREKLVDICNQLNVTVNTMPSVEDVVVGKVSTSHLKEVDIADLLGRKEIVLDQSQLSEFFSDKTVLVTGAGGSIGSEICRQISKLKPKKLLLLGHGENSIYLIHRELTSKYVGQFAITPLIADIQDRELMFDIMENYQPDVVYHAAAHKHVPLMEYNPKEAVKNNIYGTKNVAEAAKAANVAKFVMVSTDKAVNPPNVMGATKRVAEMIVTGLNGTDETQFVAVRFGNVLGSRGSVVPVFKDQIAKGGPLTVTDFRMTRYFMTIPEASRLVIQAGYLAKGGEVFVLDMGEPVKIVDLAKKVIKLSGHTVEEIGIVESGIRPGEKLYEELLSSSERVSEQIQEKIFVGKVTPKPLEEVEEFISNILEDDAVLMKEKLIEFAKQE